MRASQEDLANQRDGQILVKRSLPCLLQPSALDFLVLF